MTFAAMLRYWLRMKSAEARVLRDSPKEPGKLQVTSPLPYQSNSGPTSSFSSAMNPSRETAAPVIVLPMISSLACDLRHNRLAGLNYSPTRPVPKPARGSPVTATCRRPSMGAVAAYLDALLS
jgi:hypothetical protein